MDVRLAHEGRAIRCLFYLDLDGFKEINDTYGHDQGDDVLRTAARRLRRAVGADDLLCRIGGDEFVAVLTIDTAEPGELEHASDRLREAVCAPVPRRGSGGESVAVGVSIGRALIVPGSSVDVAMKAADRQMYEAKQATRGARKSAPPVPAASYHA
ncbi:GGDEF domain-containing protein [Spongisporangium articulatum]|uniref:GGDEF domain-containing protein n=1 Tax=Spongisporangium articulatum TaxID=3362603 RepID=A0ABW8ASG9_9ACTN